MIFESLLSSLLVAASVPQAQGIIVQKTSGWCSPAIANVVGNVTVNCIGVDPRALRRLNEQLSTMKLDRDKAVQAADEWTARYKELEARLSEAGDEDTLSRKAEDFLRAGELDKAGAILDEILDKERQQVNRYAANELNRALVFELEFRPLDALPHLEAAYKHGSGKLAVEAGIDYGKVLLEQNDYRSSEPVLLATLETARDLGKCDPVAFQFFIANTLNDLANLYSETNRFKEAEDGYQQAISIYRSLAKTDPEYEFYAETTLINLAFVYEQTHHPKEAEDDYKVALGIYRDLEKSDPVTYRHFIASALDHLALLCSHTQRVTEAEDYYKEALEIRRDLAKANPVAYQPDLAQTLNNLANLYSETGHLKQAEDGYKEALEIRRDLARANPAAYRASVATTLKDLADYYSRTQRLKEAEEDYREALEILHDLAKTNSTSYQPTLATTLQGLANLYNQTQRIKEAEEDYNQVLGIFRDLTKANPDAYQSFLAETLNNLAGLYYHTERTKAAEDDFKEALGIYRDLAKANPAEYQFHLAGILCCSRGTIFLYCSLTSEFDSAFLVARTRIDCVSVGQPDPANRRDSNTHGGENAPPTVQ